MSYYKILGFEKEPFSTSPDPDFLYFTQGHESVLTNTLIELRLKRGLSVILGDVGTGKTTLSRRLIRDLRQRGDFIVHCILDPSFSDEREFLGALVRNLEIRMEPSPSGASVLELKEALEKFLYEKCLLENKTVVLLIDEAQKLSESAMETLRVILNYETTENKLLQLVLFGQIELHSRIMKIPNFLDRISFKYTLNPLGLKEAREMIQFRIRQAGYQAGFPLFDEDAIETIHKASHGYPRKMTLLCHRALKSLVMNRKWSVDDQTVRELLNEDIRSGWLTPLPL